jgi:protein-L-isoaspartate(D-aspartate) O-methyltransferase
MVKNQLQRRDIDDERVLDAMGRVPREKFVPPERRDAAYNDSAMAIGEGQTISQPYMVALMTQELYPEPDDRVLEVGTGSGYQAAVLAELVEHVYTVERIQELSDRAREILVDDLGYTNLSFAVGDGTLGWPEQSPFDGIIVTAGAPEAPPSLLEQLAQGGRMVIPVGTPYTQMLTRYRRKRTGSISSESIGSCVFVKLIGEEGW